MKELPELTEKRTAKKPKKKKASSGPVAELAPVRHLFVDLDGTLLGNRGVSLAADFVKQAFQVFKLYGGIRAGARMALAVQKEFSRPSRSHTNDVRALELIARAMNLPLEEARGVVRSALLAFFPQLERHFYPIEGAKDFLEWARQHYTLTLATNPVWPPEVVEMRVRWAGLDPAMFRTITHAKMMHACKPSLEYYQEILQHEGVDPADCMLIGNEVRMDLPAVRAGIRVYIVDPTVELSPLRPKGALAPAWRGDYADLRTLLEKSQPKPDVTH